MSSTKNRITEIKYGISIEIEVPIVIYSNLIKRYKRQNGKMEIRYITLYKSSYS